LVFKFVGRLKKPGFLTRVGARVSLLIYVECNNCFKVGFRFKTMDYMLDFMEAKYHLAVAERMLTGYGEYPEKRFLVGIINEGARAAGRLIRAFMILGREWDGGWWMVDGKRDKQLDVFVRKIGKKYLDDVTIGNLVRMLEIERAQKASRVEFAKGDKIILLIGGKYRILTVGRLQEFVGSIRDGILKFENISG
jgi:hypothetical protein